MSVSVLDTLSVESVSVPPSEQFLRELPDESPNEVEAIEAFLNSGGIRSPVSQEVMVKAILGRDGKDQHPAIDLFPDAVHASIERMVGQLCGRYVHTVKEREEDLVQDCMSRVWDKLDKYDPEIGKFTTWVVFVCRSVLNRKYRLVQRRKDRVMVVEDPTVHPCRKEDDGLEKEQLRRDFAESVRELIHENPGRQKLIVAMLGDPDVEDYEPPRKVFVVKASREAKVGRETANRFYEHKVKPFLRTRFR